MTYTGGIAGEIPNGAGGGSAIPGTDISVQTSGLYPEYTVPTPGQEITGDITINTTGTHGEDHSLINAKLDAINEKLDHLLAHAHQPYEGTLTLNPPPKVTEGQ